MLSAYQMPVPETSTLDITRCAERRGASVLDIAAKGTVHLIVDLNDVEFLDSTGLGALVGGLKRLRAHDGNLTLAINTERILRVFRITGLTRVLRAHPSVREAIAADPDWRQHVEGEAGSVEEWCRQRGLN